MLLIASLFFASTIHSYYFLSRLVIITSWFDMSSTSAVVLLFLLSQLGRIILSVVPHTDMIGQRDFDVCSFCRIQQIPHSDKRYLDVNLQIRNQQLVQI